MAHAINWFDIPAENYERAKTFYNTILNIEIAPVDGADDYGIIPAEMGEISGGVGVIPGLTPGGNASTLIYLNGGDDLNTILNRVEGAGGEIVQPKTDISPHGFIARFKDTEGNLIGLHSMN